MARLTNVTLRQHVGHYCSWGLLVLLVVTLVLRLVLRLIQGLVLGFVLRLGLRLRLGFPVGQRGRGGGGSGRALTGAADPSFRAVQVCVDGRRSNPRRLPGHRGLVFGARRRVCAKKEQEMAEPLGYRAPSRGFPGSFPAWRCAGFNRRRHVSGATLGRHGEGHLLLLVFGQGSLHRLCMDVCKNKTKKNRI